MDKNKVVQEAVAAIPAWLAFLELKEAEQVAILAEIQQSSNRVEETMPDTGPLAWLAQDAPPAGESQQPPSPVLVDEEVTGKGKATGIDEEVIQIGNDVGGEEPPWNE